MKPLKRALLKGYISSITPLINLPQITVTLNDSSHGQLFCAVECQGWLSRLELTSICFGVVERRGLHLTG